MKKKILFVMSQFNMGGIEKELLCLFETLDRSKYTIELYLTGKGGQLEPELPDFVMVHYLGCDTIGNLKALLKHGHIFGVCKKLYYYLRLRLAKGCAKDYWGVKVGAVLPDEYDCVIAYDGLDLTVISIAEEINARKRLLWEHGPLVGVNRLFVDYSKKASRSFDKIICVSQALKQEFSDEYQLPAERFEVIYNLVDVPQMMEKSNTVISDMPPADGKILVTVGRLHPQKGVEKIPQIARMLLDAGHNIYWYLVGDGVLRQEIESQCQRLGVVDRVILLGTRNNPYPYIKNCDIYVQTSSWEGWCLTVQEARIFCKPMVVTPLPVLREQIVSGKNGLVADDMTAESMFKSIKALLDSPDMQAQFIRELDKEKHQNISEVRKLYAIIET